MDNIFYLLLKYKYIILFPLAIVEGPILAVIAGFLCIGGYLNLFIAYPVIVFGDVVGDSLSYMFGRWGIPSFLKPFVKRFGPKPGKMEVVRAYFNANPKKTIALSKITLGIGIAGIYLAGNSKVPYDRFIRICLVTSAMQFIVYMGIGMLFGSAYKQISHYLDLFAAIAIVTVLSVLVIYFIRLIVKRL